MAALSQPNGDVSVVETDDGDRTTPAKQSPKRFKACRTCKRQKMKCEGQTSAPCKRCQAAGTECIFDLIEAPKRPQKRRLEDDTDTASSEKISSLEQEIRSLRETIEELAQLKRRSNLVDNEQSTAANAPSVRQPTEIADSSQQSTALETSKYSGDLIARDLISGPTARDLFERFQARCNVYLPLFDPLIDTFESIRSRSPFCFATILAIAARLPSADQSIAVSAKELCQAEAQSLAARTLFDGTPKLETIQGMILLAAYSQKCWYIIGHAVRLAQRMRLDDSLSDLAALLQDSQGDATNPARKNLSPDTQLHLMRQVRVWMTLAHLEHETASGIGRQSMIECDKKLNTKVLLENPYYPRSDLHILAAVELLRHRDRFRHDFQNDNGYSDEQLPEKLRSLIAIFDEWLALWDKSLEDVGFRKDGFHRAYLVVQRNSAEIGVCATIIDDMSPKMDEEAQQDQQNIILSRLLVCVENQLSFILETQSYDWHFQSSPIYSSLSIASATGLALNILKQRPHLRDPLLTLNLSSRIEKLLREYPFANYDRRIEALKQALLNKSTPALSDPTTALKHDTDDDGALAWNHGALRDDWKITKPVNQSSRGAFGKDHPKSFTSPSQSTEPQLENNQGIRTDVDSSHDWLSTNYMQFGGAQLPGAEEAFSLWDFPDPGIAYSNNGSVAAQDGAPYSAQGLDWLPDTAFPATTGGAASHL